MKRDEEAKQEISNISCCLFGVSEFQLIGFFFLSLVR